MFFIIFLLLPRREKKNIGTFSLESVDDPETLGELPVPYRAVFVVRDPRDIVATSYFESLSTTREWARRPMKDLKVHSFQTRMRKIAKTLAMDAEIARFASFFNKENALAV